MSYIDFDEMGVLEIRCMNCGTPLAVRSYKTIQVKSIPPREEKVLCMRKLGTYRRKRFDLENGSYIEAFVCHECQNKNIAPEKIEETLQKAFEAQWKHENKNEAEIKKLKKQLKGIKVKKAKEKGKF